jgi:hypothetical protein
MTINSTQPIQSGTWKGACLGTATFLSWGAAVVLYEIFHAWGKISVDVCLIFFFFCFAWGWVKGFPRWWYAYTGLLAIVSAWMMSMPAFNGLPLQTKDGLLGFWAWLPLALTSLILLITFPDSLGKLLQSIWRDWTQLSFALYGGMAWLVWVMFDEIMSPLVPIFLAASELFLAAGALAFMRANRTEGRFLSLLVGMTLAILPVTYLNAIYWNGLQAPWVGNPAVWTGTLLNLLRVIGALAIILLIPGVLALVRMAIRPWQAK